MFWKKETLNDEVFKRLANVEAKVAGLETNILSLRNFVNRNKRAIESNDEEEKSSGWTDEEKQTFLLTGNPPNRKD